MPRFRIPIGFIDPTPNEIQLAQKRAQQYWAKNSQRFKTPTKYLAVYVTSIVQGDVNQGLYSKLINGYTAKYIGW